MKALIRSHLTKLNILLREYNDLRLVFGFLKVLLEFTTWRAVDNSCR